MIKIIRNKIIIKKMNYKRKIGKNYKKKQKNGKIEKKY
jgi:hypothetical protein